MGRIVILAALESEFYSDLEFYGPVFYTGIGKINAARLTTELILDKGQIAFSMWGLLDVCEKNYLAKSSALMKLLRGTC